MSNQNEPDLSDFAVVGDDTIESCRKFYDEAMKMLLAPGARVDALYASRIVHTMMGKLIGLGSSSCIDLSAQRCIACKVPMDRDGLLWYCPVCDLETDVGGAA